LSNNDCWLLLLSIKERGRQPTCKKRPCLLQKGVILQQDSIWTQPKKQCSWNQLGSVFTFHLQSRLNSLRFPSLLASEGTGVTTREQAHHFVCYFLHKLWEDLYLTVFMRLVMGEDVVLYDNYVEKCMCHNSWKKVNIHRSSRK
jgi:hypothetical protein